MRKNLKAWLHGYVLFDVNGERFMTYENAHTFAHNLIDLGARSVNFTGYNIFLRRHWRGFYSFYATEAVQFPTVSFESWL